MDGYRLIQILIVIDVSTRLLAVTLTSSADGVCPGDTLVFTCVTDTLPLLWTYKGFSTVYHSPNQVNETNTTLFDGAFNIQLNTTVGFVSNAVATSISLNYDGTNITCSGTTNFNSKQEKIKPINIESPPSSPLNLTFTLSPTLSPVTISWVAPLDTPLCVHSYTVIVRNNCNSSQVMVYNTTDNRSSLSITDLTSDCEYLVTVVGRDGAGRLGQESEELNVSLNCEIYIGNIEYLEDLVGQKFGLLIKWKLQVACYSFDYLVTHNVSSDQSPIKTNRTSVTLYGVQQGEKYFVEISIIPSNVSIQPVTTVVLIPPTASISQNSMCTTSDQSKVIQTWTIGHLTAILSTVLLGIVCFCYLVICLFAAITGHHNHPHIEKVCTNELHFSKTSSKVDIDEVGGNVTLPTCGCLQHQ